MRDLAAEEAALMLEILEALVHQDQEIVDLQHLHQLLQEYL
jgi:hypothetical protein